MCSERAAGGLNVEGITLPDAFIEELRSSTYGCDHIDCRGGHYDSEEGGLVGGDTNCELRDVVYDQAQTSDEPLFALVTAISEHDDGLGRIVDFPELTCGACGAELDGWRADVKMRTIIPLLPRLGEPPPEIRTIEHPDAASRIEWFRSDCSTYLVHLTRSQPLPVLRDNVDYEDRIETVAAPEVLWSILDSRRLRAVKGKGMRTKAVCFTEKPLAALKETTVGAEARVRRQAKSLSWSAYGVMFEKAYLKTLGVRPVLHLDEKEGEMVPDALAHRVVPLRAGANWLHEREWRAPDDVEFDLAHCIVLVPTFEQAEVFRRALAGRGQAVRGFLPLHTIFAAL